MNSKHISLREDVHRALEEAKGPEESFSDAIERLPAASKGRQPLYRLADTTSEAEAAAVRDAVSQCRERVDGLWTRPY